MIDLSKITDGGKIKMSTSLLGLWRGQKKITARFFIAREPRALSGATLSTNESVPRPRCVSALYRIVVQVNRIPKHHGPRFSISRAIAR